VIDSERCKKIENVDANKGRGSTNKGRGSAGVKMPLALEKVDLELCEEMNANHVAHKSINFYIYLK